MTLFVRIFLVLSILSSGISTVWASTGYCTPVNGTQPFSIPMGTINVSDASKNVAGTTFLDVYGWNLGETYKMTCDCEDASGNPLLYYQTTTGLTLGHSDGDKQYYQLNDYLEVSTSVYLGGSYSDYMETPWDAVSTGQTLGNCATPGTQHNVSTGSQGKVSLYIKKAFVGTTVIPNTQINSIYISTVKGQFGSEPLVNIYLSGSVVVPQTCSINAGQIVTVDFGSFMSGEFKNKGQMPAGYTPKTITVPIKCNGMDANASLTLRFQAEASADEPAAIKTSNDDVGVQITDDSGKVIEPNSGLIPFQLDDNLQGTVTFHAAPISTTGNAPAEGTFSATAYIRVDFA